jgi:predicted nucleotidyltransferase
MITKADILRRRDEITQLAANYGASNVRIFGSVARGDARENSDLDLVVRFEPGRTLLDQGGLLMDLQELLGVGVDVISEGALSGRFGEIVRKEAVAL